MADSELVDERQHGKLMSTAIAVYRWSAAARLFLRNLWDHILSRWVVIAFALLLYAIADSANLQVLASFADLTGPWERSLTAVCVAFGSLALFAARPSRPTGKWKLFDIFLFLLPPVVISYIAPWSAGGQLYAAIIIAILAFILCLWTLLGDETPDRTRDSVAGLVVGTLIVSWAAFSLIPVELPRLLGAPVLVMLFLSQLAVLVGVLSRWPRVFFAALGLVGLSLVSHEFQHEAKYKPMPAYKGSNYSHADPFALWLFDRPDTAYFRENNLPYPVFLIASEGGGGYAKAHAFTFLSRLTERCASFPTHLFAMVGVSGGQVGNMLYHANMTSDTPDQVKPCSKVAANSHVDYLTTDHLSPLLAHLLFVEVPRKILFLGPSDKGRSHVLFESFNRVSEPYQQVADIPYWEHFWKFDPNHDFYGYKLRGKPALVAVTTNVETGNRFVFTPFDFETRAETNTDFFRFAGDFENVEQRLVGPTLGSVSLASAAFPWVTPTLRFSTERAWNKDIDNSTLGTEKEWIEEGPNQIAAVNLADGGYFENSGAETLSEIVASINGTGEDSPMPELACSSTEGETWQGVDNDYRARSFGHLPASPCEPDVGCAETMRARPIKRLSNDVEWGSCEVPFFLSIILIRNTGTTPETSGQQSFLSDPIRTLLQTRTARGDFAIANLEERRCGFNSRTSACWLNVDQVGSGDPNPQIYNGVFQSLVDAQAMHLPLGWNMPREAMARINANVVPNDEVCVPFDDGDGGIMFTSDNGSPIKDPLDLVLRRNCSHVRQVVKLFDADAIREALSFRP